MNRPSNNAGIYPISRLDVVKKIVTWNVSELLCFSTPHSRSKIVDILKELNADCIFLQGVYNDTSREIIINSLKDLYQYYITGDLYNQFKVCEHSGLLVISKYPIFYKKFISFSEITSFPDKFTNKGCLYLTINEKNFAIADCPYYKQENLEDCFNLINNSTPFSEYIVIGTLQHKNASQFFGQLSNNTTNTNSRNTISDYILSLYNEFYLTIMVKHINEKYVSYNYPVIGFIKTEEFYDL